MESKNSQLQLILTQLTFTTWEFFINTMCKIPFQFFVSKLLLLLLQKIALEELFPKLTNVQHIQKLWDSFQQLYTVL